MKATRFVPVVAVLGLVLSLSGFASAVEPPGLRASGVQEIDRGFLFWEGRYVEAPYVVERQGLAVHISGIPVTLPLAWPPERTYYFDHDPGLPEGIERDTSLEDALGVREPGGILFDTAKQWYLFTHESYEDAYAQMTEYYRSLACVKSMYRDDNGIWVLESYRGERRRIAFGGSRMRLANALYGPGGTGLPTREEYVQRVEDRRARFQDRLRKGDCLLLFEGEVEISFGERRAASLLPEVVAVMRSPALSSEEKMEELFSLGLIPRANRKLCQKLVSNWEASRQLEGRLDSLRHEIVEKYGARALKRVERNLDLRVREEKADRFQSGQGGDLLPVRGVAYSPDGVFLYGWCGYTYDLAFSGFPAEIAAVVDYIKDQDFQTAAIYTDATDDDSNPGTCTYASLKGMQYADFLYYACHGWESVDGGYIEMLLLETEAQVNAWSGNDPLVIPVEITDENWSGGHPWAAAGTSAWPTNYWNGMLTQSKAIEILSCCYSHENGWVAACGGGVGFGYEVSAHTGEVNTNNKELLERMNGTKDDGDHRKAGEAYDNMPAHLDQFEIEPAGADITLCPAYEEKSPEGAVGESGTGYFQVDTYCHDTVPANEALTFATTGNVTIRNVHWVGSGKVRRIEFDWCGTCTWSVTATAHADKFRSWGAATSTYHKMDGNRVTPNGDDVVWSFSHTCTEPALTVKCRERIYQNTPVYVTDLHLKVWQKEDDVEIVCWRLNVVDADVAWVDTRRGDQPEPSHSERETLDGSAGDPDNGMHAVDVDIYFNPPGIAPDGWVTVDVEIDLTQWNTQRLADVVWTLEGPGKQFGETAVPDHGWALSPPRVDPGYPGSWCHTFSFCNDEAVDAFLVTNLELAVRPDPIDMGSLESFTDWDVTLVGPLMRIMLAESCMLETIVGPEGLADDPQHVYGHYQVWNDLEDPRPSLESWFDHYDYLSPDSGTYEPETAVGEEEAGVGSIPVVLFLAQNDPNPFHAGTEIRYGLPAESSVNLTVYNLAGQKVRTLVDAPQTAGVNVVYWDGRNEGGARVAPGLYFYRLRAGDEAVIKKMVLLR